MSRRRVLSLKGVSNENKQSVQELGCLYDYLAKIIVLGLSGSGKTCLLHRYTKGERPIKTSETIALDISSKIVHVGTGNQRRRIKLQLWDTAGTERFQAISRMYYRGAAGALLLYDISSRRSFNALDPFLRDARASSPSQMSIILVGNKLDLDSPNNQKATQPTIPPLLSHNTVDGDEYAESDEGDFTDGESAGDYNSRRGPQLMRPLSDAALNTAASLRDANFMAGTGRRPPGGQDLEFGRDTVSQRQVSLPEATEWAQVHRIPVAVEVSAHDGTHVDGLFQRLAHMILTKIELGLLDPGDPSSGVQYGDSPAATERVYQDGLAGGDGHREGTWSRGCCG